MQSCHALEVGAEIAHLYSASVTSVSHCDLTCRTSLSSLSERAFTARLPRRTARSSEVSARARGSSERRRSTYRSKSFSHLAVDAIGRPLQAPPVATIAAIARSRTNPRLDLVANSDPESDAQRAGSQQVG